VFYSDKLVIVNTDADGCIYPGYLSLDQFEVLNKKLKYRGIQKAIMDTFEKGKGKEPEDRVKELVGVARDYGVTLKDYERSAEKIVESSKIDKHLEKVLRLINPSEMNVFTLSGDKPMRLHVKKRIQPVIPYTKTRVFGTKPEFGADSPHIITGRVTEIWGPHKRAEKAKELTGDRECINISNDHSDTPLLKNGTLSFFLTEEKQGKESNIVYINNLSDIPMYLRQF
jgi:hypothetical protein